MMSVNALKYKGELLAEDNALLAKTPGILGEYKELRADALEADTLDLTVVSESGTLRGFRKNDKVEYFRAGLRRGVYYLQSVTREGPKLYRLSALSAVGLLIARPHRGGIYTGQTVAEVVADICGDVPVLIETVYRGIKLYGWLPIATARDNLAHVLFAIGAWLHTDENGVLRVQKLWNGTASIIGAYRVHAANIQLKYLDPVSAVAVTEHQYIAGTEELKLFEGTVQQGDVIEFDEPAHSLTADGFTILESGANYAVLSAGTGTLTGKKYIHNMRVVTRTVTEGAAENVEEVRDATLVSLVNSSAVAQRMADYYACREQISVDVNPAGEHAGHVVELWNEWDKKLVSACIASRDTKVSGLLKSRTTALVGYLPPQPESAEYFDERVLLTGAGEWTVPEGVTEIGYILMSGAEGGHPGNQGGTASASSLTHTWRHISSITGQVTSNGKVVMWGGPGGVGGLGGIGGRGSKVYQGTMSVKDVTSLAYQCGVGGLGAVFGGAPSEGGATTLGEHSSDEGSYSENGWTDPTTGKQYAQTGQTGLPGGNGAGAISGFSPPSGAENLSDVLRYQPSTGARDEDGKLWPGAPTKETSPGVAYFQTFLTNYNGTCGAYAGYALGAGGAVGATPAQPSAQGSYTTNDASAVGGQTGATPTLTPKKAGLTQGGRGGYGGGGGSAASWAGYEHSPDYKGNPSVSRTAAPGPGGVGGRGGPGGDGCIIIFYRKPKPISSGALKTSDGLGLLDALGRRMIV